MFRKIRKLPFSGLSKLGHKVLKVCVSEIEELHDLLQRLLTSAFYNQLPDDAIISCLSVQEENSCRAPPDVRQQRINAGHEMCPPVRMLKKVSGVWCRGRIARQILASKYLANGLTSMTAKKEASMLVRVRSSTRPPFIWIGSSKEANVLTIIGKNFEAISLGAATQMSDLKPSKPPALDRLMCLKAPSSIERVGALSKLKGCRSCS